MATHSGTLAWKIPWTEEPGRLQSMGSQSESESHSIMSASLQSHGLYSPWNSPGQNTGVGSHSLLQGIFPIQGSNWSLPHCRQILYNVVLVSTVQQSERAIHINISPHFGISFPFRSLQSTKQSSLCYTLGSTIYVVSLLCVCVHVHTYTHTHTHTYMSVLISQFIPLLPSSLDSHIFAFYVCFSFSAVQIRLSTQYFF